MDREVNRGKGFTVKEGMLAAIGRIRLFSDADNSTDIAHFDKMVPLFKEDYDIVIASRHSKDVAGAQEAVAQARYKRIMGQVGNRIIQSVAVPGIWDTQCGFKAFRDSAAEKIFSVGVIEGWGFDIETLALARALHYKIGIVPAYWINKPGSHVGIFSYVQVLLDIARVRRGLSRANISSQNRKHFYGG